MERSNFWGWTYFKKYAIELFVEIAGTQGDAHNVWISSANVFCLQIITTHITKPWEVGIIT